MAPGRVADGDLDLHADGELVLEDRQRLALTRLLEVCRFGEDELRDANAVGRRNRQDRWNQGRIARRVRLNVQCLRQPDEQRCSGPAARVGFRLHDRRELGSNGTKLGKRERGPNDQQRDHRGQRSHLSGPWRLKRATYP